MNFKEYAINHICIIPPNNNIYIDFSIAISLFFNANNIFYLTIHTFGEPLRRDQWWVK